MVRTCTGPVATRIQVQMQSCQHGPKSAIRHDISPCLQCTLRNRKCCVLQVRLSGAEPVHWVSGLISNSQCGVRALRSAMQASTTMEEVFPRNLKSRHASFLRCRLSCRHADKGKERQIQSREPSQFSDSATSSHMFICDGLKGVVCTIFRDRA